jgi:hypothetical protein
LTSQKVQDVKQTSSGNMISSQRRTRGRTALTMNHWKWKILRLNLQWTETTMVLMMREVLAVKVSVTNTHTDVTTRPVISRVWYTLQTLSWLFVTNNRTWCKQSVASSVSVQGKPVERPTTFFKDLLRFVGIIFRNITRPSS